MSCPRSWRQLLRLVAESTELIFVLNIVKWKSFHSQRILAAVMKKQEQKPCLRCIQYVQSLLLNFAGSRQQTSRATLKELPIFSEFTVCIFMKGFLEERLQTFCMWRIPRHFYMYFFFHTHLTCVFDAIPNVASETCCNGWRGCGREGGTNWAEMANFISFAKSTLTLVTLCNLKDS